MLNQLNDILVLFQADMQLTEEQIAGNIYRYTCNDNTLEPLYYIASEETISQKLETMMCLTRHGEDSGDQKILLSVFNDL